MSNNNYKNYHNYQNYQKNHNSKVEEVKTPVTDDKKTVEPIIEETVEPTVEPTKGFVTNCTKLRVRAAANTDAEVLCEINEGTRVIIDEKNSTNDFYKICTETGIEGYCMKQFISVE